MRRGLPSGERLEKCRLYPVGFQVRVPEVNYSACQQTLRLALNCYTFRKCQAMVLTVHTSDLADLNPSRPELPSPSPPLPGGHHALPAL